jgi:photosystem II stability/assembly factor-like uncharacterized protein
VKTTLKIFLFLFIAAILKPQELTWHHLGGPMGGCIGDFAIDSQDNIYAGVYTNLLNQIYEGIYKSTDNGESWTKLNTGIEQFEVYAIYINGQDHIYVGTNYGDRIYRSTDEGSTWQIINNGYNTAECWAIGENKNGSVLFAGDGQFGGLYRTTDYGSHWLLSANLPVLSFAVDSLNNIYCGTFIGLYKSTDDGLNWHPAGFNNIPVNKILIGESNRVICGTGYYDNGQGVFYSDDYGNNWTSIGLNGKVVLSLAFLSNGALLAGTLIDGLFQTSDWGTSWTHYTNGLFNKQVFRLNVNSNDDIFIGSENEGIFRSKDMAENFRQVGLPISGIYNIDFMADSIIVCGTVSGVQTYNRFTGEWKNIGLQAVLAVETTAEGELLAATNGGGLFQSTDMGASWINICQTPFVLNVKKINNTILAATDTGLIRSTNNGLNWFSTPVKSGVENCAIEINANGDIWAVGNVGRIFKSTDNGVTFLLNNILDFSLVDRNNLFVKHNKIYLGELVTNSYIFYSIDYGNTWQSKYCSNGINSIEGEDSYVLFSTPNDIIFTTNTDTIWESILYPEYFYGLVKEMGLDENGDLFFGTSSQGLYQVDFIVGIDEDISAQPKEFEIYDLYPNPFNSTVNLVYSLPQSSEIKISISNVLGERISIYNYFRYSGKNEEQISFEGLVSGIYFISIESKDFFAVKKAVFLK